MADDKCAAVPLAEQLRSIPRDAVLRIDTPNTLGCMDTRSIPVGRLCHEAADALGVAGTPNWRAVVGEPVPVIPPANPDLQPGGKHDRGVKEGDRG